MFDDINLLPDDLRDNEEKERAKLEKSRRTSGEVFSYSKPEKQAENSVDFKDLQKNEKIKEWSVTSEEKKAGNIEKNKDKKNFFSKLFGLKNQKPAKPAEKPALENHQPIAPLNPPKPEPISPLPPIIAEKKPAITEPIIKRENKPADKSVSHAIEAPKKEKISKHFLKDFIKFLGNRPLPKSGEIIKAKPPEAKGKKIHLTNGDKLNSPSDSLEVNLVPAENNLLSPAKIFSFFLLAVIGDLVIIGFLYGLIFIKNYKTQVKSQQQDQKIEEKILAINEIKGNEAKAAALINEVNQVENILNKHIYWTNFFQVLEKYTLNNVYYGNLAATKEGIITLSATTDDYQSVAKQLLTFQNASDFTLKVEILGATKSGTEENPKVNFNIGLTLNQNIFLKPLN